MFLKEVQMIRNHGIQTITGQVRFLFLCILVSLTFVSAERVGKILYAGHINDFDGKNMVVPKDIICMSEIVHMPDDSTTVFINSSSIFFIIDHSGSMYSYHNTGSTIHAPRDSMGHRFTVTQAIIDTFMNNPERFPEVECGLSVFANNQFYSISGDDMFEPVIDCFPNNNYKGGYLPLLGVAKEYPEYGNRTGGEILTEKLETTIKNGTWNLDFNDDGVIDEVIKSRYRDLTAPKEDFFGTGTDIHGGFRAAVDAQKKAINPRRGQYIVFISDGEHNGFTDDFINGVMEQDTGQFPNNADMYDTIPTTFTIFFTPDGEAPPTLETMNGNIKNNSFSSSNKKFTMLWPFNNTTQDSLISFFMEKIVSIFESDKIVLPVNIVIDGMTNKAIWDEDKKQFVFPDVIPLVDWETDFGYEINYTLKFDTLDLNDNVVNVEKDTTLEVAFVVEIDKDLNDVTDTFDVFYWDRDLRLLHDNDEVTIIDNEDMNELTLEFTYDKGDAKYEYSEVEVEVTHTVGNTKDSEVFKLEKQGSENTYTFTFKREVSVDNIVPGDNVLQHFGTDTIVAIFRNSEEPKLPLDTLRITAPVRLFSVVTLNNAIYFDNNADGCIDSLFIGITGADLTSNFNEIYGALELPDHRNLSYGTPKLCTGGMYIPVKEDDKDLHTRVTDKDVIEIKNDINLTNDDIILLKAKVNIIDSMAPVIMDASYKDSVSIIIQGNEVTVIDSIKPRLTITFSEPIEDITRIDPFLFYCPHDDNEYQLTLNTISINDSIGEFSVEDEYAVHDKDSINIYWKYDNNIYDKIGNNQDNKKNIKRELKVHNTIDTTWKTMDFNLIPKSTILEYDKNYFLSEEIQNLENLKDILENYPMEDGKYKGVMMITLQPDSSELDNITPKDSLEGWLSIYDALGNKLLHHKKMAYDKIRKQLIYVWDGKNRHGRQSGSGSYIAVISVKYYFDTVIQRQTVEKIILGIKQ